MCSIQAHKDEIERLRNINTELLGALKFTVGQHDYSDLDRGVGTATPDGVRWLAARVVLMEATVSCAI